MELLSLETIQALAREYGYWTIFGGMMLENTGIPVPGETITIVGGFLAGVGELNYWLVLVTAITGAVLGDNFGYWIGRWGGWPLLVRLGGWCRISVPRLEQLREQFLRNAPRAVFLGRFITLLRVLAGPLAGIAQMPYPQFFLCNAAGAGLWAVVTVTVAFLVGQVVPLEVLAAWMSKAGALGVVLLLGAALTYWGFESYRHRPIPGRLHAAEENLRDPV